MGGEATIRPRGSSTASANGGWSHPNSLLVLPPAHPRTWRRGGLDGMVFAGAGPAGAAIFSNPFDVAKVRMQLQGEARSGGKKAFTGILDCMWKTGSQEGIRGLQKGLSASIIREGSKNFFRIGLFHPVLDVLHPEEVHDTSPPIWKRLVAGSVSGTAGAVICNPIEIVKTRLQASSLHPHAVGYQGYRYTGFVDAFVTIGKKEGAPGLWAGTGVSTVRSILSTSANMTVNTSLKEMALDDPQWAFLGLKPGPLTDALCSLVSAFFAVLANNPADVVRTRVYNQPFEIVDGKRQGQYYKGAIDCFWKILNSEGPLALFKGFSGHFMRTGPHYVVAFMLMGAMERATKKVVDAKYATAWSKGVDDSYERFASPEHKGWTVESVESALTEALPRHAFTLPDAKYAAMIREDAREIMAAAGREVLGRKEFVDVGAPLIDRTVARRHGLQ